MGRVVTAFWKETRAQGLQSERLWCAMEQLDPTGMTRDGGRGRGNSCLSPFCLCNTEYRGRERGRETGGEKDRGKEGVGWGELCVCVCMCLFTLQ